MTIYKSKWYLEERMTVPAYFVHQELGSFKTWSEALDKRPADNLFPCKGSHILKFPKVHRLTRALSVKGCDMLDQAWVDTNVDFDRASEMYTQYPRKRWNELVDWFPSYEWCYDTTMGDIWALCEIAVEDMRPGELDWKVASQYESTRQYVEWFQQGHIPPPLFVVRHVDGDLISLNRRRWLAAREAGVATLPCWYSPTTERGRQAWERKLCTWDRSIICIHRREGGDCTDCPSRPDQF